MEDPRETLPQVLGAAASQAERYSIGKFGARVPVKGHLGELVVTDVIVSPAERSQGGARRRWRVGVALRNRSRGTRFPRLAVTLYQGAEPLGQAVVLDGETAVAGGEYVRRDGWAELPGAATPDHFTLGE